MGWRKIGVAMLAAALVALAAAPTSASPAAVAVGRGVPAPRLAALARGINITGWFRFVSDRSGGAMDAYVSNPALRDLHRAGFTFVRLPFDPTFAEMPARRVVLIRAVLRIERAGLAVVLVPAAAGWHLETQAADRAALLGLWRALAPALRALPMNRTFPEVLNEPVFGDRAEDWSRMQARCLAVIRAALPASTVVLSGPDWSSIAGLKRVVPPADADILYTIHFYDPAELTSLAAYHPGLDRAALAHLPFPVTDDGRCRSMAHSADPPTAALIAFVCGEHWDETAIIRLFAEAAHWGAVNKVPLLLGEFGASARLNAPARSAWLAAVRRAAARFGIGWALWGYDDVMGFDLPRPPPQRPVLDPGVLKALGLL